MQNIMYIYVHIFPIHFMHTSSFAAREIFKMIRDKSNISHLSMQLLLRIELVNSNI